MSNFLRNRPSRRRTLSRVASVALVCGLAGVVAAQEATPQPAPEPAPPAKSEPAPAPTQAPAPTPAREPTLDELLGITPSPQITPADSALPPAGSNTAAPLVPGEVKPQTDLDRRLAGQDVSDDFEKAVAMMGDAARLLREQKDPGLATQRVQDEVLKSLDKLISDAQKQQQQKKSQKQKQKQQQPQQSEDESKSQKQSKSGQQKQQQQQQQPAGKQSGTPQVPRSEGAGKTRAGNAAAWGDLPARVRDSLVEGINDRFSSRYRQKTEEYYKRLAEEKKAEGGGR